MLNIEQRPAWSFYVPSLVVLSACTIAVVAIAGLASEFDVGGVIISFGAMLGLGAAWVTLLTLFWIGIDSILFAIISGAAAAGVMFTMNMILTAIPLTLGGIYGPIMIIVVLAGSFAATLVELADVEWHEAIVSAVATLVSVNILAAIF